MTPEPFVPAKEAAQFVGIQPAFPHRARPSRNCGCLSDRDWRLRKTWVFRLSELAAAIDRKDGRDYRRPPEAERAYHPVIRRSLLK